MSQTADSINIYLHIPFCNRKCPYCDFNSYPVALFANRQRFIDEYVNALISEIDYCSKLPAWSDKTCRTVFWGGGTPSYLSANQLEKVMRRLGEKFPFSLDAELTLEANPETLLGRPGKEKLRALRDLGINRLSIGAQSFSKRKLEALGREHLPNQVRQAVLNVYAAGFSNISLDLIFGVVGEELDEWQADLISATELSPRHLSAYSLMIEKGSKLFQQQQNGVVVAATEESQAQMYDFTRSFLNEAQYQQYEISNFARKGFHCRHNVNCWSRESYLGIGAGAHGFCQVNPQGQVSRNPWGMRWSNICNPVDYLRSVKECGQARQLSEVIDNKQAKIEFFFLTLRQSAGFTITKYEALFGSAFQQQFGTLLEELSENHLLNIEKDNIRLTSRGFLFSDSVFEAFAAAA